MVGSGGKISERVDFTGALRLAGGELWLGKGRLATATTEVSLSQSSLAAGRRLTGAVTGADHRRGGGRELAVTRFDSTCRRDAVVVGPSTDAQRVDLTMRRGCAGLSSPALRREEGSLKETRTWGST